VLPKDEIQHQVICQFEAGKEKLSEAETIKFPHFGKGVVVMENGSDLHRIQKPSQSTNEIKSPNGFVIDSRDINYILTCGRGVTSSAEKWTVRLSSSARLSLNCVLAKLFLEDFELFNFVGAMSGRILAGGQEMED